MSDTYFFIFGIVVAIIGLLQVFFQLRKLTSCKNKITATVTSLKTDSIIVRGSTVHTYSPEFSYEFNGNTFTGTAPFSTTKKDKYSPGEPLTIYIDTNNPAAYRFGGEIGRLIGGIVLLAIGLLFVVLYLM